MAEDTLDGEWSVSRRDGLLPPLWGVRKRIEGARGWTCLGPVRVAPFDVIGLELRYRAPFRGVVDVLSVESPSRCSGRATFGGRELGTFAMTRIQPR